MTQSELESQIKVALGGTIAEEIVYREISNGATSDLKTASSVARSMVKEFGMSRLGRVHLAEAKQAFLPGRVFEEDESGYSENTAQEIDTEVNRILDHATEEVRTILKSRRAALEAVAQRLIEKEVIDGVELRQILEQHDPGPRLVPGTLAVEPRKVDVDLEPEPELAERALRMEEG
jgi:cell division protease FtsH